MIDSVVIVTEITSVAQIADEVVIVTVAAEQGLQGSPGISAYQQAVLAGFVGTEQEWLDSIADSSFSRLDFHVMDAPSAPGSDRCTMYLTGTGVSPARLLELKIKNQLGDEVVIASWIT